MRSLSTNDVREPARVFTAARSKFDSLTRATVTTAAVLLIGLSQACASAPARPGAVYVRERPPARVVEVIRPAPSRAYVWIPGYHAWRGSAYVWVPGRYEIPAAGFRRYEAGRWQHNRNGWFWVEGRWR